MSDLNKQAVEITLKHAAILVSSSGNDSFDLKKDILEALKQAHAAGVAEGEKKWKELVDDRYCERCGLIVAGNRSGKSIFTPFINAINEADEKLQQAHATGVREGLETAESENRSMLDMVRHEMDRVSTLENVDEIWKGGHYLGCRHIEVKIMERIEELKMQLRQKAEGK